jgi:hypothetical protein
MRRNKNHGGHGNFLMAGRMLCNSTAKGVLVLLVEATDVRTVGISSKSVYRNEWLGEFKTTRKNGSLLGLTGLTYNSATS